MAPPSGLPERRKDPALRALYNRVEALEKMDAERDKAITVLEREAVTYKWLIVTVLGLAVSTIFGANQFAKGVEESTAKATAKQGEKLDRFIELQSVANVKTEAMYLNSIERRSREEVREAVHRSIPKEK